MIQIFSADGTGPIKGSTRGPRGPKKGNSDFGQKWGEGEGGGSGGDDELSYSLKK